MPIQIVVSILLTLSGFGTKKNVGSVFQNAIWQLKLNKWIVTVLLFADPYEIVIIADEYSQIQKYSNCKTMFYASSERHGKYFSQSICLNKISF